MVKLLGLALRKRVCPHDFLDSRLGTMVHPLMHRRAWMSVPRRCYIFISEQHRTRAFRLAADIADELRASMVGMFFEAADIRALVSATIFASDATPIAAGLTSAQVSRQMASLLFEFAEHRRS